MAQNSAQNSAQNPDELLLTDNNEINATINKHLTISSAVNELTQKLPFSEEMYDNMIMSNYNKMVNELTKHDQNIKWFHSNDDINKQTDDIISSFNEDELSQMKQIMQSDKTNDQIKFYMNWDHICNAIQHEMWPKLANIVRAVINNADESKHKILDIHDVIKILRNERYLAIEERQYLTALVERAKAFDFRHNVNYTKEQETSDLIKHFSSETKGLNKSLLQDVFDVHRSFLFSDFNFRDYTADDFKNDIERNQHYFGSKFYEQYIQNLAPKQQFNLRP
eukprot:342903_1